jgi:glycosyltransferase involved in cell wall biosynthesis
VSSRTASTSSASPLCPPTGSPRSASRQNIAPDAIVIGSVGRLVEQKDYPTQLRAFALAAARNPALVMLLLGDGPLRGEIEELAGGLGIAGRLRFAGHSNEVPVALRAMDIYVLASKFEPYGVAILEAKAAGCAIVATRVNEVPEILSEDRPGGDAAGRLVPPADPAAMAEAFVALAADPAARKALGARAAREAAHKHSLHAAIHAYQGLYDELRGPARAGSCWAGRVVTRQCWQMKAPRKGHRCRRFVES